MRRQPAIALSAVLLAVAAQAHGGAPPAVPAACAERVTALRTRFEKAEHRPHVDTILTTVVDIEPPRGERGALIDRSFVIVERGLTATAVQGQPAPGTVAGVRQQIEASLATRRLLDPTVPARAHVGLVVDRRVSAREALALVEGLGAFYDVDLVTREDPAPTVPQPPPPARVAKTMEEIRRASEFPRKLHLAQQAVADALAGCAGHQRFFAALKDDDEDGEVHFHQAILAAANACSCVGIDLDMLAAITLALDEDPSMFHAIPVQVRRQAKRKVVLAPTATVEDVVPQLPSVTEPFAVRWTGKAPR